MAHQHQNLDGFSRLFLEFVDHVFDSRQLQACRPILLVLVTPSGRRDGMVDVEGVKTSCECGCKVRSITGVDFFEGKAAEGSYTVDRGWGLLKRNCCHGCGGEQFDVLTVVVVMVLAMMLGVKERRVKRRKGWARSEDEYRGGSDGTY